MDERRILSTTRHSSTDVSRVNFATVRKGGLDPNEVRTHLESVAREMGHLENRIRELQEHLSEAQRRAANPTFDEATLASALGAQSAAILRSAHEEAGRVTAEAQERSTQLFAEAQQKSAGQLIEAQERAAGVISDAEATAGQIDHDARLSAERLIESAKVNGEALVERAREQGRAIVEQAQEARRGILNDLAVKRKSLHLQIEQLRAARDSLTTFVSTVKDEVEEVLRGLLSSDEAARSAALEALRTREPSPEPSEEELLAGTPLREIPEVAPQSAPEISVEELGASAPPRTRRTRGEATAPQSVLTSTDARDLDSHDDEDTTGTDVVNEIFARLRKATLEERGASAAPRRVPTKTPTPATPDGELFVRRDRAIEPALSVLTRRLKRALQDDQNVMLERLRDVTGMITTELEDEHVQRARFAEAVVEPLHEAAAAGGRFTFDESGAQGPEVSDHAVREYAMDLAVTIVVALRKRILSDVAGDGPTRANEAYREWRGARVERLCADAARRAFNLGVVTAARGRTVRFVVAPNDAPCDACSLDASSGERRAGQPFPSGSIGPPLHAGCACAVVVIS